MTCNKHACEFGSLCFHKKQWMIIFPSKLSGEHNLKQGEHSICISFYLPYLYTLIQAITTWIVEIRRWSFAIFSKNEEFPKREIIPAAVLGVGIPWNPWKPDAPPSISLSLSLSLSLSTRNPLSSLGFCLLQEMEATWQEQVPCERYNRWRVMTIFK